MAMVSFRRGNFSSHGTASMLFRRCERSGGHTACDGKVCCRSPFIPIGGAGATAVSQSQHELMTSLVVLHYVSKWQRSIVRTIE